MCDHMQYLGASSKISNKKKKITGDHLFNEFQICVPIKDDRRNPPPNKRKKFITKYAQYFIIFSKGKLDPENFLDMVSSSASHIIVSLHTHCKLMLF